MAAPGTLALVNAGQAHRRALQPTPGPAFSGNGGAQLQQSARASRGLQGRRRIRGRTRFVSERGAGPGRLERGQRLATRARQVGCRMGHEPSAETKGVRREIIAHVDNAIIPAGKVGRSRRPRRSSPRRVSLETRSTRADEPGFYRSAGDPADDDRVEAVSRVLKDSSEVRLPEPRRAFVAPRIRGVPGRVLHDKDPLCPVQRYCATA